MRKQPDLTSGMRSVLVDWLVEVGDEFSLTSGTLYLAVSVVDRFLSLVSVLRGNLQLVGTAAMYMAAKLEEIYPPELPDFAYITDNTYCKKQVRALQTLKCCMDPCPEKCIHDNLCNQKNSHADCSNGKANVADSGLPSNCPLILLLSPPLS